MGAAFFPSTPFAINGGDVNGTATCTLNGQIVARMAMSASLGSFSASKVIIGYGGIVPGCIIADDTGRSVDGDLEFQSFAGDFAFLNQDIGSNHTSESSAQTFTCAQSYLPGTHQFTTPSGITRGQVYDQSGNYIGGHDQAVLPGIDEQNHRRLNLPPGAYASSSSSSGLLTIKIGFTGP